MLIREKIKEDLVKTLEKIGVEAKEVIIQHAADPKNGDYSSNVALQQYKNIQGQVWQSPLEFAKNIADNFPNTDYLEKVEAVSPGFINFFLSESFLQSQVGEILSKKENYAKVGVGRGKKVQVEFISANPTGPLTLGNGRGGFLGDALANILAWAGYGVEREYYINDYGTQIRILGMSLAYVQGLLEKVPEDVQLYQGDYIKKTAKRLCSKNLDWQDFEAVGRAGAQIILNEYIKPQVEKKMGIYFDCWFSEYSQIHQKNLASKTLRKLEKKGVIYKKDGAIWFKTAKFEKSKDHVLVKKNGELTYHLTDICYHQDKFRRGFSKVIDIWGADHFGHAPLVYAAVKALGMPDDWLSVIIVQLVRIVEKGKMVRLSKRRGTIVTIDDLLEKIPLDVVRFFFLMRPADTHLDFDLALAEERSEKNPVYYVQYAYARICSILRKAEKGLKVKGKGKNLHLTPDTVYLLNHPAELALIKKLIQLPELVEDIAKNYQVHTLCFYLIELADLWHKFYEHCRVVSDNQELTNARLQLVLASAIILRTGLNLLGISAPEKM